ncbi:TIGR02678 family protein [Rhodococcus artemisiae]|uniref:TIGR02678 family protein n=1 Tax=Rhodococcus artemisiae TaxID=714159 RepID=A0ABU7LGZ5_9NOCA|nr:TIGR02678 family protein [Rhodococcus artemisiae]MEE2060828.1 TIGR02678 family protein [Rhodococcus artemisiae]
MSTGTAVQDAAGRRDAARAMLQRPILTALHDPDSLDLVRRHSTALRAMFADRLGYTLIVETEFARLVKTPLDAAAPLRPLHRATGGAFGAIGYTYLALTAAALLAPGQGDRIPMAVLVEQVRADAAARDIEIADGLAERRHLVAALQALMEWGVVGETDLGDDQDRDTRDGDEVVLTVCRPLLRHLTAFALHDLPGPSAAITARPETPRRRLYRRLVEDPFTARDDLDPEALDVLIRERAEIARLLDEDFGLVLEVRTEGALAYDPDGNLTDLLFPGSGTVNQAALLLISELVDIVEPVPGSTVHVDATTLENTLAGLVATHARNWRGEYVRDVTALCRDVTALLVRLGLAHARDDGLLLTAPAARYRPTISEGPQ